MNIIGIDPGAKGGAVSLDGTDSPLGQIFDQAYRKRAGWDLRGTDAILGWLGVGKNSVAFIEKATPIFNPKTHVASAAGAFSYGVGYGLLLGILAARGAVIHEVPPRTWQKAMGITAKQRPDREAQQRVLAGKLFPGVELRASDRCRKPHMGIVAALLIAEYGRRTMGVGA